MSDPGTAGAPGFLYEEAPDHPGWMTWGFRDGTRFNSLLCPILVRLEDGRELRLREFGTKQRAWAKLLPADQVVEDEMVATLGPEAWPPPPLEEFAECGFTRATRARWCYGW